MNLMFLVFGFAMMVLVFAKPSSKGDTRIVGGHLATKPYAYQVSVQAIVPGQTDVYGHTCGGAIVSTRHILTGGHCIYPDEEENTMYEPKDMKVKAGTHDAWYGGTQYDVVKLLPHENYIKADGKRDRTNDVSIITVKGTIMFEPKKVEQIKYSSDKIGGGVKSTLAGWGSTTDYTGGATRYLMDLKMVTVSEKKCNEYWVHTGDDILCAMARTKDDNGNEQGACAGDSGGPLVNDKTKMLIGVAQSVSPDGCASGVADLFVRVSTKVQWIQENTQSSGMQMKPQKPGR